MHVERNRAATLGHNTLEILDRGQYTTPAGKTVQVADAAAEAVRGTVSYPPEREVPAPTSSGRSTVVTVVNETTLAAARRLADAGLRPAALNFASARHPGGGFLSGARAQEESLARSSALYACLRENPMYALHDRVRDPLYTHYVIYSPDVLVFRLDDGTLLDRPYLCSFVTCPAVNAKVVLDRNPSRRPQIRQAMSERVARVLSVFAAHEQGTIVLGAWGCGVFGNDPEEVAGLFAEALNGPYRGVFVRVIFAISDWSRERRFIEPFERAFPGR